jgi:hypothetical protein
LDCVILEGNPADTDLVEQMLDRQKQIYASALTLITPPCTGQKGHHLVRRCFFTEED